jgi:hypothetical protein
MNRGSSIAKRLVSTSQVSAGPSNRKRGRKPAWRDGYLEQAKKLVTLGATDAEMANFFGVSHKTLTRWKISKPEFCLALKAGKDAADARVERRLYERALGYSVEVEKVFCWGGKVIRVKTVEHHPPDTTACIFWLKNRQPEKWSYKFKVEQAAAQWNFIGLVPTDEEWIARYGSHPEPLVIRDDG